MAGDGREFFVTGHSEYAAGTLDAEYRRDVSKGLPIALPKNYYRHDRPEEGPLLSWRTHGQMLYARNPGGAPANVAVAAGRLGAHTAFLGKAGNDMHGKFLKSVLEEEKVDTSGLILDDQYFTTLAFVEVNENGERTFSFARKPGGG